MAWPTNPRPAKSIVVLRDQYNAKYPNRNKDSDGMLGDVLHLAKVSDHNPDKNGVVHAVDITHDPAHGLDIARESEILRQNRDPRIKYVIANARIFEPANGGWVWKPYSGTPDPHYNHMHISVNTTNGDDASPWNIEEEDMYQGKTAQEWARAAQESEKYKQAIVKSIAWPGDMNQRIEKILPVLDDLQQFKKDALTQVQSSKDAEEIVKQLRDIFSKLK